MTTTQVKQELYSFTFLGKQILTLGEYFYSSSYDCLVT